MQNLPQQNSPADEIHIPHPEPVVQRAVFNIL